MLAAAVNTFKGLFVQKTNESVTVRNLFHKLHCEHIGIHRNVCRAIHGSHFVLGGCHFVMLCLGKNAVTPEFFVQIAHILAYSGLYYAEIVVFQLLSAGYGRAEKRSSRKL